MTSRLYVRQGGAVGASDTELTAFLPRKGVPFFDGDTSPIEMGMRCANGEASQGTFKLLDPIAELPRNDFTFNLPAHTLVTWTENAPGAEIWLFRGRNVSYDGGRGVVAVDNQVEFDVVVEDGNIELRGQAFTEAWERPVETDFARIAALRAYTLNGSGSTATNHRDTASVTVSNTHLTPNTNTLSMPAKTYPVGTQPQDVIQDCADTTGKIYGVVIHHDGGSHLCLLYILETDHSTYPSPIKISDNLADWDPTDPTAPVFEPHWEAGKATLYDGHELVTGLVNIYSDSQSVFDQVAGSVDAYDYWVDSYYDSVSGSFAQAADRLYGLLAYRSLTHVTHRVSIIMQASQLDLVAAGMSLQIKAAAALGGANLDTYQTRRIAECRFEPRIDGTYWAHLNLDRAQRRRFGAGSQGSGNIQPAALTPRFPGAVIPSTGGCALISTFGGTWALDDPGICDFDLDMVASGSSVVMGPTAGAGDDFCNTAQITLPTDLPIFPGTTGLLRGRIVVPALDPNYPPTAKDVYLTVSVHGPSDATQLFLLNFRAEYDFIGDGGSGNIPPDENYYFESEIGSSQNRTKIWSTAGPKPDAWTIDPAPTQTGDIDRLSFKLQYNNINIPEGGDQQDEEFIVDQLTWCSDPGGAAAAYYNMWTSPQQAAVADGTDTTFNLPANPAGGVLSVTAYINGVYEPITSFDSGARTFTFGEPPDAGDVVDVAWVPTP